MNNIHTFSIPFGDSTLTIETGKLAGQANGAVTVRHGDTVILATATGRERTSSRASTFSHSPSITKSDSTRQAKSLAAFSNAKVVPANKRILLCRLTDRSSAPDVPQRIPQRRQYRHHRAFAPTKNIFSIFSRSSARPPR